MFGGIWLLLSVQSLLQTKHGDMAACSVLTAEWGKAFLLESSFVEE